MWKLSTRDIISPLQFVNGIGQNKPHVFTKKICVSILIAYFHWNLNKKSLNARTFEKATRFFDMGKHVLQIPKERRCGFKKFGYMYNTKRCNVVCFAHVPFGGRNVHLTGF